MGSSIWLIFVARLLCLILRCDAGARTTAPQTVVIFTKPEAVVALIAASARSAEVAPKSKAKGKGLPVESSVFSTVDPKTGKRKLTYYGLMLAGAMARTVSATAVHPLNVCKTMLQKKGGVLPAFTWNALSRGVGSQFIMSIPHGAINFAVTETTKIKLAALAANSTVLHSIVPKQFINPLLDFTSSAVSTFISSIVSTPQMVITDRIMSGQYSNFFDAVVNIARLEGSIGFFVGWLPAMMQKIPSYALTWMFIQQLKLAFLSLYARAGTGLENTLIGGLASAAACAIMIPIDTIKTRIVTQPSGRGIAPTYSGIVDCAVKVNCTQHCLLILDSRANPCPFSIPLPP